MKPRILFSISSLGLGHATRMLPIIRAYLPTHDVHIVTSGDALILLRHELARAAAFYDVQDCPALQRGTGWRYYAYLFLDLAKAAFVIRKEHAFFETLAKRIRPICVVSDGRYGSYFSGAPSFLVTHQVSFAMPKGMGVFRGIADRLNCAAFKNFDAVLIPDYADPTDNLAGELSHHPMLSRVEHHYVGILSSLHKQEITRDIDILFITGGYLAKHKPGLTERLITEAKKLNGKKIFVLGDMSGKIRHYINDPTIEIMPLVFGYARQELLNRAKMVVTRGGYTTIMDLVELGMRAVLIPTPGQTEQEYLSRYLQEQGYFLALSGGRIVLEKEHLFSLPLRPFNPVWKTEATVERVKNIIKKAAIPYFFSIIIPAHNEEAYIGETLRALSALQYPADRFEVIVVENGSTDRTHKIAQEKIGPNGQIYVSERGVSKAKNFGLEHVSAHSDWTIFLDADTRLGPNFLQELNAYLYKSRRRNISVGTTRMMPLENSSRKARAWFAFYNWGHKLTKTSFAIQFMRSALRDRVRFDETVHFAEDLKLINDLQKYGAFCYVDTKDVRISTRRFDTVGWFRQFIIWNWEAITLSRTRHRRSGYQVIR